MISVFPTNKTNGFWHLNTFNLTRSKIRFSKVLSKVNPFFNGIHEGRKSLNIRLKKEFSSIVGFLEKLLLLSIDGEIAY